MFVRKRDAIEAHLTVVFTALAVARETQNRQKISTISGTNEMTKLRAR